jgi:hypothetical protein
MSLHKNSQIQRQILTLTDHVVDIRRRRNIVIIIIESNCVSELVGPDMADTSLATFYLSHLSDKFSAVRARKVGFGGTMFEFTLNHSLRTSNWATATRYTHCFCGI